MVVNSVVGTAKRRTGNVHRVLVLYKVSTRSFQVIHFSKCVFHNGIACLHKISWKCLLPGIDIKRAPNNNKTLGESKSAVLSFYALIDRNKPLDMSLYSVEGNLRKSRLCSWHQLISCASSWACTQTIDLQEVLSQKSS